MEIVYIWLKNYKYGLIKEQGFNFNSRYRFYYNESLKTLDIYENNYYIEDFFNISEKKEYGNIANVTALVGENGAGKTSILDLIKNDLIHNLERDKEVAIIILKDGEGVFHVLHHENIKIEEKDPPKEFNFILNYQVYNELTFSKDNEEKVSRIVKEIQSTNFIFYSNIFDAKDERASTNLANISTNYLLRYYKGVKDNDLGNDVVFYRIQEIIAQVQFLSNIENETKEKFRPIPERLIMSFSTNIESQDIPFELKDFFEKRIENGVLDNTNIPPKISSFKKELIKAVVSHIIIEIQSVYNPKVAVLLGNYIKRFSTPVGTDLYGKVTIMLRDLSRRLKNEAPKIKFKREADTFLAFSKLIESNLSLLNLVDELVRDEHVELTDNKLFVNIERSYPELNKLLTVYENSVFVNDFLVLDWQDLSSGQKAKLTLFSRLYSAIQTSMLEGDIIILIDEGESYLHPQWQKAFLKDFLDLFPRLIGKENRGKKVQIIMTSNSPFLVSDLPSSNIIFLKKDQENNNTVVVDGLEDNKLTFASNIHTLLAHSFFMNDGAIGNFARMKINEIIDLLLSDKGVIEVKNNRKLIQNTIYNIGEPVIRNKLISMLDDILKIDYINIENRMDSLQSQIENLVELNNLKTEQKND
ncbi:AAA family ATPase [Priestia megaterium]|uniref:AAA family ATPase n=1 Tax=Priestia megaterium TaxID=1404 RepID=UPI0015D507C5|nr:AAA family ATPase [Priestia megaterium]